MEKLKGKLVEEVSTDAGTSQSQNDSKVDEALDYVSMAQSLKGEGNKLFQRRDYERAMVKYEEAIMILPKDHVHVSDIRAYIASCYMQLDPVEWAKAVVECDLALSVTPDHSKALLKRARCYEGLNKLDLALKDVCMVLELDPNNPMASDIREKLKKTLESKGLRVKDSVIELSPDYVEPVEVSPALWAEEAKARVQRRKKSNQGLEKSGGENAEMEEEEKNSLADEKGEEMVVEKQSMKKGKGKQSVKRNDTSKEHEKVIIEERLLDTKVGELKKIVKLVYSEDIRRAKLPLSCTLFQLREVVHERFPGLRAVRIKYKDQEGDLVTITTNEELHGVVSARSSNTLRLYIVEVSPEQDPFFGRLVEMKKISMTAESFKNKVSVQARRKIEDWMVEFAKLFKIQAKIDSDRCLNLQELGMKLNSEAMEEMATSEEAQGPFDKAALQFQEVAARSLLKMGNVYMSGARKRLSLLRDLSGDSVSEQVITAYEYVQKEHAKAKEKYEMALKIKPDLFEVFLALGLQQFEEGKFSWYYVLISHLDLKTWPYAALVQSYENAERNIRKSMEGLKLLESKVAATSTEDSPADEESESKSWLDVLLCAVLYERSIMECKLELPIWRDNLEAAMKKFEQAGITLDDVAEVTSENYVADYTLRDLKEVLIEIYEAKQWRDGIPQEQLEEILQKRTKNIFHVANIGIERG